MKQAEFNFSGPELRDAGISLAVENAGESWKERTWELFKEFLSNHREPFLMENFRSYLAMIDDYEFPPSLRAYGWITKRGLKEGLIKTIGTSQVKNPKAHCATANLLIRISN